MFFSTILPISLLAISASVSALPGVAKRDDAPSVDPQCWTDGGNTFVVILPNDGTETTGSDGSGPNGGYDTPGNCAAGLRANLNGRAEVEIHYECYYSNDPSTANSTCTQMILWSPNPFGDEADDLEYAFNQATYEQLSVSCTTDGYTGGCPPGYASNSS
jgi:hypothetical protein